MTIKIRSIVENEKQQVIDLLNEVFQAQEYFTNNRTQEWWNWKYERNVFGKPIHIVATSDERLVGFRSFWPWEFICRGQVLKAYQPVDTVVHPDFQGLGLFTKLTVKALKQASEIGADLLFNFPNQNSLPGYLKLGWNYVSKLSWLVKPLRPFHLLKTLKNKEKAIPVELDEKYRITPEMCDELIERESFDGLLRTRQSKEFLWWRYGENLFFKYGALQVSEGRKKLSAIFEVNQKGTRREMIIVDILGSSELIRKLFKELIIVAKSVNVDFVTTIVTNGYEMEKLRSLGFMKVRKKNLVALPLNLSLENKAISVDNWRIVGGMHDAL
ncbi:MAG TPA: GNAT family N-acetyltransferase [Mesotoga infera]|nr:GNAT family N-acetyltransferase [Mesotoga infera]HRV02961.1 GNAT family N-acetyltransferase [Mesotoga sp.]